MRHASIVLPRPTSSARSQRTGSARRRPARPRGAGAGRSRCARRGTSRGRGPGGSRRGGGRRARLRNAAARSGCRALEAVDRVVGRRERPEERGRSRRARPRARDVPAPTSSTTTGSSSPSSRAFCPSRSGIGRSALSSAASVRRAVRRREPDDDPPAVHLLDAPRPEVGLNWWKSLSSTRKPARGRPWCTAGPSGKRRISSRAPDPGPRSGRPGARGRPRRAGGPAASSTPAPRSSRGARGGSRRSPARSRGRRASRVATARERGLAPALHVEREHPAEARHLPRRDGVAGVRREARVVHARRPSGAPRGRAPPRARSRCARSSARRASAARGGRATR